MSYKYSFKFIPHNPPKIWRDGKPVDGMFRIYRTNRSSRRMKSMGQAHVIDKKIMWSTFTRIDDNIKKKAEKFLRLELLKAFT